MLLKLALVLVTVCAISAQILPPLGFRRLRPGPIIHTDLGPVQGQDETYDLFRRIYTFKGIRYAQAPVGDLRFRQGVWPTHSPEVHQAWEYGSECPQFSPLLNRISGDEDCLFLNIATPRNIRSRLPVVVSIHGGGLQSGNGEMSLLGPELMLQENLIFVSFNYRLNVLGFLNTNDANAPGNYGLKDMIMVLQWIQRNIENFGGNPDDVTIMGISGGGVAVHALVVSPLTNGLFHKALSHSGSLFNNWAFNRSPTPHNNMLRANLQLAQNLNNQQFVAQLREVSVERLLNAAGILHDRVPRYTEELTFTVSVDAFISGESRVITAPIETMLEAGNFARVPYMIGFNSAESLNAISDVIGDTTILERFNQNPHLLVPTEWDLPVGSPQAQEVITAFRNVYFHGSQQILPWMLEEWAQYVSDRSFIFGVSKQARLHSRLQQVHYFRFSYSGSLSLAQRLMQLTQINEAMHGDDHFYLYRLNLAVVPVLPSDEAFTIQRRFVRMWTNFFKYSNPTPSLIDPVITHVWPNMTVNEEFMDIGRNLAPGVHPFRERMDVWHAFDLRFPLQP